MTQLTCLRTMTFNIRGGNKAEDGINTWSNRAALNVHTIVNNHPDILGLQECQSENLDIYHSSFNDYMFYLGHKIDEHTYNPILWKSSRFDFVEAGQFWLSPIPNAVRPSRAWNASTSRAATWVKLNVKEKNLILLFVNNHWDHISEEARCKSAYLVSQKVFELWQDGQLPAITFGDFNCSRWRPQDKLYTELPSTNEPYNYLAQQGFVDCFLAAGNIDSLSSNTFHGFMGEGYEPQKHHMLWRADWILLLNLNSRMRVQNSFIARESEPPLYPSDHYPVVADFIIS